MTPFLLGSYLTGIPFTYAATAAELTFGHEPEWKKRAAAMCCAVAWPVIVLLAVHSIARDAIRRFRQ